LTSTIRDLDRVGVDHRDAFREAGAMTGGAT
jgi:hypothetical protein